MITISNKLKIINTKREQLSIPTAIQNHHNSSSKSFIHATRVNSTPYAFLWYWQNISEQYIYLNYNKNSPLLQVKMPYIVSILILHHLSSKTNTFSSQLILTECKTTGFFPSRNTEGNIQRHLYRELFDPRHKICFNW